MLDEPSSKYREVDNVSRLIHSGRTSLSVVLGFLEDLYSGRSLTDQDTIDAIDSGRKIKEVFESLARSQQNT